MLFRPSMQKFTVYMVFCPDSLHKQKGVWWSAYFFRVLTPKSRWSMQNVKLYYAHSLRSVLGLSFTAYCWSGKGDGAKNNQPRYFKVLSRTWPDSSVWLVHWNDSIHKTDFAISKTDWLLLAVPTHYPWQTNSKSRIITYTSAVEWQLPTATCWPCTSIWLLRTRIE